MLSYQFSDDYVIYSLDHVYEKVTMSPALLELLANGDSLIHIGAHFAEERLLYQKKGISVMWVEACPLFEQMIKKNLKYQPDQLYRICALDKISGRKKYLISQIMVRA